MRVIVVGNTNIKKGITTTNFATTPDVPVSSVTVNLPDRSALRAGGEREPVRAAAGDADDDHRPERQGRQTEHEASAIASCGVRIVGQKVVGNIAYLTVQTFAAGTHQRQRVEPDDRLPAPRRRRESRVAEGSAVGQRTLQGRPFSAKVRVGFVPKKRGEPTSVAFATVTFR